MASPRLDKFVSSRIIGPLAIVLALLVLIISELGHQQIRTLNHEREASMEAQLTVGRLRRSLLFMESATRGYLVAGRSDYLDPYFQQLPIFAEALNTTQKLALKDPLLKPVLVKLIELCKQKQSVIQEMIRLFKSGDRLGALVLLETDVPQQLMLQINDSVDEVMRLETINFSDTGEVRASSSFVSRLLIWILVITALLGATLLMRLGRERERDQKFHMARLNMERELLEGEVNRRTAETESLALHMDRIREEERGRLARELHDELGGLLTAAKLDVARLRKRLPDTDSGQDLLRNLIKSLDAGIALKRRIIEDLRPSALSNLGLQATLLIYCQEFAQRAEIKMTTDIADISLLDNHALTVYRLVQEALTNVAKYAGAEHVKVSVVPVKNHLEVCVVDDGKGFENKIAESAGGHGLQGMRFRVRACGGDLRIRSSPGNGTSITATIPLHATTSQSSSDPSPAQSLV